MEPVRTRVIDAHHHLWPSTAVRDQAWQPAGVATLRQSFEPADLREELEQAGVEGTVLMQSVDSEAENDRLLAYARSAGFVRGVVAWAPLDRPARAQEVVDDLLTRAEPRAPLVGVRALHGADPMEWVRRPDVLAAFRHLRDLDLAWDVVPTTEAQRDAVVSVARAVPGLRVVVDHLAAPPLEEDGRDAWRAELHRLAAEPGVAVKLSVGVAVLTRMAEWAPAQVAGWVEDALVAFGPERSMVASNWPVVLLQRSYRHAWRDVVAAVEAVLGEPDTRLAIGGTASRWYRLGPRA